MGNAPTGVPTRTAAAVAAGAAVAGVAVGSVAVIMYRKTLIAPQQPQLGPVPPNAAAYAITAHLIVRMARTRATPEERLVLNKNAERLWQELERLHQREAHALNNNWRLWLGAIASVANIIGAIVWNIQRGSVVVDVAFYDCKDSDFKAKCTQFEHSLKAEFARCSQPPPMEGKALQFIVADTNVAEMPHEAADDHAVTADDEPARQDIKHDNEGLPTTTAADTPAPAAVDGAAPAGGGVAAADLSAADKL